MTEERSANVTAATSDLESDMTFKDLLDGTRRGRLLVRSLKGLVAAEVGGHSVQDAMRGTRRPGECPRVAVEDLMAGRLLHGQRS